MSEIARMLLGASEFLNHADFKVLHSNFLEQKDILKLSYSDGTEVASYEYIPNIVTPDLPGEPWCSAEDAKEL